MMEKHKLQCIGRKRAKMKSHFSFRSMGTKGRRMGLPTKVSILFRNSNLIKRS